MKRSESTPCLFRREGKGTKNKGKWMFFVEGKWKNESDPSKTFHFRRYYIINKNCLYFLFKPLPSKFQPGAVSFCYANICPFFPFISLYPNMLCLYMTRFQTQSNPIKSELWFSTQLTKSLGQGFSALFIYDPKPNPIQPNLLWQA